MKESPIVPVVTFTSVDQAVPVAEALVSAGIRLVEVALRTHAALDAISAIRTQVPSMIVGAGTLKRPEDFPRAHRAGAQYIVSPGATPALIREAANWEMPWLPAASTVTEMMHLNEHGYTLLKFFPAESLGGPTALGLVRGPLPDIRFCPSGGIDQTNFLDYLALDNVIAVGGSWLTPVAAIESRDRKQIEASARNALALIADRIG